MEVIEDTGEKFHIASQPSIISQAIFLGFFAFGFTLSFYSESFFWQLLYIFGSFIIASSFLGHWQKLVIEKVSNKLHYSVQNIYQKLFVTDKYLVSETLTLDEMKQVKCNLSTGTISFYHNFNTITVYIGKPDNCGAILEKLKSLLPVPTISHHDEQPRQDSNEETEEQSGEVEEAYSSPDAKGDFEQPEDIPKTSSFDNLKEEDDGLSSDESFVKIDDKEFAEGAQNTDLSQESAQGEDRSRSDDDEDTLNQDK